MNTLEAISIPAEIKEIKIFNNQPTTSHAQCTDHASIYFVSDKSTIKVDIQAHLQKDPGWGSLKWTKDAQVPAGKQALRSSPQIHTIVLRLGILQSSFRISVWRSNVFVMGSALVVTGCKCFCFDGYVYIYI